MTKIAILTVNYNAVDRTKKFLESLNKSNNHDFEVFVVDNNSSEENRTTLRNFLADAEFNYDSNLIEKETNNGWGTGLNSGFKYINQKNIPYTFVCNNDCIVAPDAIDKAIAILDANKDVGICSGKVMDLNGDIQTVGGKYKWNTMLTGITYNNIERQKETTPYILNDDEYIDDCAWVIRSELMKDIQYPEHIFLYFEEMYIQNKVKEKGLKLMTDPSIEVFHEMYGSSGGSSHKSPLSVFYITRNRIIWMKEQNPKKYPLFIFNYFLFVLPAFVCLYAIKRRWKLIPYLFKGTSSARAWIKRKEKILFTK